MARPNTLGGGAALGHGEPPPPQRSFRERFSALRNLGPFLKLVWHTSPALTTGDVALRLVRSLLPVATLYVGKLIIDEVVRLAGTPGPPSSLAAWLQSGHLH